MAMERFSPAAVLNEISVVLGRRPGDRQITAEDVRASLVEAEARGYQRAIDALRNADHMMGADGVEWWKKRRTGNASWVKGAADYLDWPYPIIPFSSDDELRALRRPDGVA